MGYMMTDGEMRDLMRVTASDGCEKRFAARQEKGDSLLEQLPMSYASVIWTVAQDAIHKCHCYGHLCGHCDDARVVLGSIRHTHAHSDNGDQCGICGEDLRHEIHRHVGELSI